MIFSLSFYSASGINQVSFKDSITVDGSIYGKSGNLNVCFTMPEGANNVKGIQLKVELPSGFSVYNVSTDLKGWDIDFSANRIILSCGNDYESLENISKFSNGSCQIATLAVNVADGTRVGEYTARIVVEDVSYNNGESGAVNSDATKSKFYYKAKISSLKISGADVAKTFNGLAQTQNITISDGTNLLKNGVDYTVTYKNNINAGKADAIIQGKGYYTDIVNKTFTIKSRSISDAQVSGLSSKNYTGKAITPKPTVKVGSVTLKYGTDYTLSYTKNKLPGKAQIVITGKGNYTGTLKKTFTISLKNTKIKSVSGSSKKLSVKWSKVSSVSGYQIRYSTASNFKGAKTVKATKSATSRTIKSLKAKKKYYVSIRTYVTVSGKTYYSGWASAKSVKTK